jgi:hypothetical protein
MRISVALATHNGERYLPAQLRSLARQTRLPYELVIYDDCSTDGTVAIAERFAGQAPIPVLVLRGAEPAGPHEAFVRAAAACQADAIAFCDQDDVWVEHKLERCAAMLSRDGVLLAVHSASVVRHDLRSTGRRFPRFRRSVVTDPGAVDPLLTAPGFATVFHRSLLDWGEWASRPPSRYWPGAMTHDEWIALLGSAAGRTAFIAEPLALYRQHPAQLFGVARRGPRESAARLFGSPPEAHEQVADLRDAHARYLRRLADAVALRSGDPGLVENLERSARLRERSAQICRRRALVYERGLGRAARLARVGRLIRNGGYGPPGVGGLGRSALARDASVAVAR